MINGKNKSVPENLATNVVAVGAGCNHTCALTNNGNMTCWMLNEKVN